MIARVLTAALMALLAGCSYENGEENPVMLSLTWFSYVGAQDIRDTCTPVRPDRFRLVYNGDYGVQIRTYDITAEPNGGGILKARVRGPADLTRGISLTDPLGPWRGWVGERHLPPEDMARLRADLESSGLMTPGPEGLRLVSNEYYWVGVACVAGSFHLNAWKYPSARYKALRFPEFLVQHDPTGVPINTPPERGLYPNPPTFERAGNRIFEFRLEGNRLLGASAYFGK